jgi:hypothetical protein
MTTPTPTPQEENSPQADAIEMPRMGFFKRVQRILQPEPEPPIHPTEAAEIVIMDEGEGADEKTRF